MWSGNVPKYDQNGPNVDDHQRQSPIFTPIVLANKLMKENAAPARRQAIGIDGDEAPSHLQLETLPRDRRIFRYTSYLPRFTLLKPRSVPPIASPSQSALFAYSSTYEPRRNPMYANTQTGRCHSVEC